MSEQDYDDAEAPKKRRKPVDFDELFPGRFLKSGELLGKRVTVTIADVEIEELDGEKGPKVHGIIFLRESEKQIVLNRTNGEALRAMFGRKVTEWAGKRITIYADKTRFGAKIVDCIRVWGSPDIATDITFELQLPRKRPQKVTMHRVQAAAAKATQVPADDMPPLADESGAQI